MDVSLPLWGSVPADDDEEDEDEDEEAGREETGARSMSPTSTRLLMAAASSSWVCAGLAAASAMVRPTPPLKGATYGAAAEGMAAPKELATAPRHASRVAAQTCRRLCSRFSSPS